MRDRMESRGPDDGTLLAMENIIFAHRRLAIRDRDGGKQPVVSGDGRFVITYNGEIYNDGVLRQQLTELGHPFSTYCDTEVLAAAWQAWGQGCVDKLRGMFAFAVYDLAQRRLTLVRDRFGIKPLFYTVIDGEIVFASTIAAIRQHPRFSAAPDLVTLQHYLSTLRLTIGERTVFDGIATVGPAEIVSFHNGDVTKSIYWKPPLTDPTSEIRFDEAVDQLEHALRESVSMRLASDVPVGMMLSGGVDSSLLAHTMRDETQQAFPARCGGGEEPSIPSDGSDFEFARECARQAKLDFGEVRVDSAQYLSGWHRLVSEYDTPVSTPTDVIINHIARDLRKTVGVAIGGEGADEACCGYQVPHWSGADFELFQSVPLLESNQAKTARKSLQLQYGEQTPSTPGQAYLACNGLIPTSAQLALLQPSVVAAGSHDAVREFYDQQFAAIAGVPNREKTAHLLLRLNLESLLSRLDSATMLESLEARVPFTDHILVEQLFRLPLAYRIDVCPTESSPWRGSLDLAQRGSLRPKRLIHALAGKLMSPGLAQRPKASFPTPLPIWLQKDWKSWLDNRLWNSEFARALFQPSALEQLSALPPHMSMWKWPIANIVLWGEHCFA